MNSRDTKLSKALSWLLRHGAVREGFTLSPEGYLPVQQILQHQSFRGFSSSDVERVVVTNSKQRFKLRLNPETRQQEIKANQGHTLDVTDADLKPLLEPVYTSVVHGTYFQCWPQIRAQGLSRMRRKHIHFAKEISSQPSTSGLRQSAEVHIFVDLPRALSDGLKFFESDNGVILTPGNEQGVLETKYFERVVNARTGQQIYP